MGAEEFLVLPTGGEQHKKITLLVCVLGIFKNPSEMEQFEKATGDVGIWAKEG